MRLKSRTERKLVNGNLEVTIPVFIRRERNSVILDKVEKEGKSDGFLLTKQNNCSKITVYGLAKK